MFMAAPLTLPSAGVILGEKNLGTTRSGWENMVRKNQENVVLYNKNNEFNQQERHGKKNTEILSKYLQRTWNIQKR